MAKLSPELSAAILRMPIEKRNKLLLRLIAKNQLLIKQLQFELLEDKSTVEDRTEELRNLIHKEIQDAALYYFTPGNLMMTMRALNARITEHAKVTKDKLSEVTLTLFLLTEAFRQYLPQLQKFSLHKSITFSEYVIRRTTFVLKKAEKLHEDYYIEFQEELNNLLHFIYSYPPIAKLAKDAEIPDRWSY